MIIKKITAGKFETNTYFIMTEGGAIVIDPGDGSREILNFIKNDNLNVKYVLLTHGHFDHINSTKLLQESGAEVYLHSLDAHMLNDKSNLAWISGVVSNGFAPDYLVEDGYKFNLLGLDITVMHTPGHTKGSVCYLIEDSIFSGDTLFYLSVGRTDFPTGSSSQLENSIANKLFALPSDYTVYPGHGMETSLKFEKENNPYV